MSSRSRSRVVESSNYSGLSHYDMDRTEWDCDNNATVLPNYLSWNSTDGYSSYTFESMEDVVTADFHKLINQGKIINNPLSHTIVSETNLPCSIDFATIGQRLGCDPQKWYDKWKFHYHGEVGSKWFLKSLTSSYLKSVPNYDSRLSSATSLAAAQAWSNIDHSEILAYVSLAEADKTLGTVRSIIGKAYRLIKLTRKKAKRLILSKRGRKKLFNELSDLYLEARYGLRPMYYDARAAISYYRKSRKTRDRYTFRGFNSFSGEDSDELETTYDSRSYTCTRTKPILSRRVQFDVQVRTGVLTKLDLLTESKLLGLTEIPQSLWELVPFSFIIDWFTNVGDIIGTWSPKIGTSILAEWTTVKSTVVQTTTISDLLFEPYGETSTTRQGSNSGSINAFYSVNTISTNRSPNLDKPLIPRIDINLDPAKVLDLVLIAKSLKREKQTYSRDLMHRLSTP